MHLLTVPSAQIQEGEAARVFAIATREFLRAMWPRTMRWVGSIEFTLTSSRPLYNRVGFRRSRWDSLWTWEQRDGPPWTLWTNSNTLPR